MKRCFIKNKELSPFTTRYCCEDHFDLETDVENWCRFKVMGGGRLSLKKNVVPHKFECQKKRKTTLRKTGSKRHRLEIINNAMSEYSKNICESVVEEISIAEKTLVTPEASFTEEHGTSHTHQTSSVQEEAPSNTPLISTNDAIETSEKGVQVNIKSHVRSKSTSTLSNILVNTGSSPIKTDTNIKYVSSQEDLNSDSSDYFTTTHSIFSSYSTDYDATDEMMTTCKEEMKKATLMTIEKHPKLYLGIPNKMFHVINLLTKSTSLPTLNILITLKKIRLDDSFAILATQFGMSIPSISRIFISTVACLSANLKQFIFWPSEQDIWNRLPIAFRARYAKTQSIIDCLEIQIEKPSNPLHQALTWSEYKGCNTIKYLVSCTPDGLVNFVSPGYGGRGSDTAIIEMSGYLDLLKPGMDIILKGCTLIRPPSVSNNELCSSEDVKLAKRIAALRIHVVG